MPPNAAAVEADDVPVLGSARAGLRFELVTVPGPLEEVEDPFLPLSEAGRFSRVLLARIAMGEDSTLRAVALKVPRNSYRPLGAGIAPGLVTNPRLDEAWERERAGLKEAAGPEIVPLLDLGGAAARSRPVTFCKKTRAYFHPLCPRCHAPLEDCRDDALLRDAGLTPYSAGTARYLHCRPCAARTPTFYSWSPPADERPKGGAVVRRRGELYRDGAAIFKADVKPEARARLERVFPCYACAHRAACYPPQSDPAKAVPAEALLTPLSYHEFTLLPLEALPLRFDELCDLLGGAPWAEIRQAARAPGAHGRDRLLEPLEPAMTSPFQWIYRNDPSGRYPVEVLRLKLIAFSQLCRGVRAYHARSRRPHLDLSPANCLAEVTPTGPDLPARWGFQVKLTDLGSPLRFQAAPDASDAARDLLVPPPDTPRTYQSPLLRQAPFGEEQPMRVTVRAVRIEGGRARLEAEATSPRARLAEHRPGDMVRLAPSTSQGGLENASLWGVLGEPVERGFRLDATLEGGRSAETWKTPFTFDADVAFFRRYHVPCDLYGLGMLLLRAILVNDGRDIVAVDEAVQRVLGKLMLSLPAAEDVTPRHVAAALQIQLDEEQGVFDRSAPVWARAEREGRPNALPAALWSDILLFAFRLLTNIRGFSVCADHADYPADRPESVMDRVLEELGVLGARAHVELFARGERDREVARICDDLISEITGGDLATTPPPEPEP